jgi:hypothetical protein
MRHCRATYPFETFVETVTRRGARSLNVPRALAERVETKLVGDLGSIHGVGQVLHVSTVTQSTWHAPACWQRRAKERPSIHPRSTCVALLISLVPFSSRTLFAGLGDTLPVVRVDDKNDALGVLEI